MYFSTRSAPPWTLFRRTDITQLRNLTSPSVKQRECRLTAAWLSQFDVMRKHICWFYFQKILVNWTQTSAFMATDLLTKNVWLAPGQDAPSHLELPPLADGLKGEDHGQVFYNTRDAITGSSSSFQDHSLVGYIYVRDRQYTTYRWYGITRSQPIHTQFWNGAYWKYICIYYEICVLSIDGF